MQERPWGQRKPENFRSARKPKGHPLREARRSRAAERLAAHVHGPTCRANRIAGMTTTTGAHVRVTVTMPHADCPGPIARLLERVHRERPR